MSLVDKKCFDFIFKLKRNLGCDDLGRSLIMLLVDNVGFNFNFKLQKSMIKEGI